VDEDSNGMHLNFKTRCYISVVVIYFTGIVLGAVLNIHIRELLK